MFKIILCFCVQFFCEFFLKSVCENESEMRLLCQARRIVGRGQTAPSSSAAPPCRAQYSLAGIMCRPHCRTYAGLYWSEWTSCSACAWWTLGGSSCATKYSRDWACGIVRWRCKVAAIWDFWPAHMPRSALPLVSRTCTESHAIWPAALWRETARSCYCTAWPRRWPSWRTIDRSPADAGPDTHLPVRRTDNYARCASLRNKAYSPEEP